MPDEDHGGRSTRERADELRDRMNVHVARHSHLLDESRVLRADAIELRRWARILRARDGERA